MASISKIRESVFFISWVHSTLLAASDIEIDIKEVFSFCKLSYFAVGTETNLAVEVTLNKEMKFKSSLDSITVLASKHGVKQNMKFEDGKWKANFKGNLQYYICCGRIGLRFELAIDATPSTMVLMNKKSKNVLNNNLINKNDNLLNLWTNKTLADVTFQLEGKAVRAHTLIVSSGSPVLAAMFQHDFQERKTGIVEIKDIKRNVFEQFLSLFTQVM